MAVGLVLPVALFWLGVAAIPDGMPGWLSVLILVLVGSALTAAAMGRWIWLAVPALANSAVVLVLAALTVISHGASSLIGAVVIGGVAAALPAVAVLVLRGDVTSGKRRP